MIYIAISVGLMWSAVLVSVLIDRLKGREVPCFNGKKYHLPMTTIQKPLWWRVLVVVVSPVFAVVMVVIFVGFGPLILAHRFFSTRK